jgi:hypothetical protein
LLDQSDECGSIVIRQLRDNEDMTNEASEVELSVKDLRVVARYPQRALRTRCRSSRKLTLATGGLV